MDGWANCAVKSSSICRKNCPQIYCCRSVPTTWIFMSCGAFFSLHFIVFATTLPCGESKRVRWSATLRWGYDVSDTVERPKAVEYRRRPKRAKKKILVWLQGSEYLWGQNIAVWDSLVILAITIYIYIPSQRKRDFFHSRILEKTFYFILSRFCALNIGYLLK